MAKSILCLTRNYTKTMIVSTPFRKETISSFFKFISIGFLYYFMELTIIFH